MLHCSRRRSKKFPIGSKKGQEGRKTRKKLKKKSRVSSRVATIGPLNLADKNREELSLKGLSIITGLFEGFT